MLRISLAYGGGSLPWAWQVWQQNVKLLPPGVEVVVVADRAYDIPPFVDRIAAHGWHGVVRAQTRSSIRLQDWLGRELALAEQVKRHLPTPGRRGKMRGRVFKDAGWRAASVVGLWAHAEKEPCVVLTDLPARWEVLRWYDRRFWIEPGFRNDKSRGWRWEECQVQGMAHHQHLLTAMAWATLVALCLGLQ